MMTGRGGKAFRVQTCVATIKITGAYTGRGLGWGAFCSGANEMSRH